MTEPRKCEHCGKELELVCEEFLNGMPLYYLCPCQPDPFVISLKGHCVPLPDGSYRFMTEQEELHESIATTIPRLRERGPI